jgi:S1-C subfamily serine protease
MDFTLFRLRITVKVDAANDLALLKADGRFAPLPIAVSRTVALGGTVATVGFPDIGFQEDGI